MARGDKVVSGHGLDSMISQESIRGSFDPLWNGMWLWEAPQELQQHQAVNSVTGYGQVAFVVTSPQQGSCHCPPGNSPGMALHIPERRAQLQLCLQQSLGIAGTHPPPRGDCAGLELLPSSLFCLTGPTDPGKGPPAPKALLGVPQGWISPGPRTPGPEPSGTAPGRTRWSGSPGEAPGCCRRFACAPGTAKDRSLAAELLHPAAFLAGNAAG